MAVNLEYSERRKHLKNFGNCQGIVCKLGEKL